MKLHYAEVRGKEFNADYPFTANVHTLEELKEVAQFDNVCKTFKGDHRDSDNYISADCVTLDIDNTHSDDPETRKDSMFKSLNYTTGGMLCTNV